MFRHKTTQTAERLKAGNQWTDSGLVFTTELGGAVDPRNLLRVADVAATKAGYSGVGVHTLRHSAAVGWLEIGCPHQGRRRPTRALAHQRDRRCLRAHLGQRGPSCCRWVGRCAAVALDSSCPISFDNV